MLPGSGHAVPFEQLHTSIIHGVDWIELPPYLTN